MSPRAYVVAALLVLAGLFGMHGLAGHGTAEPMAGMQAASAATPDPAAHGSAAGSHDGSHDGGGTSSMGTMGAMCLAVLVGLVLALLVVAHARRRTPWSLPRQVVRRLVATRGRAPDPPSLSRLCVLRC